MDRVACPRCSLNEMNSAIEMLDQLIHTFSWKLTARSLRISDRRKNRHLTSQPRRGSKRKVILIVSYLGTNYHGSAMNTNDPRPTITGTLFAAITKIGGISESNSEPHKVAFSSSSRTDKGVHAAAATFSLKMINLFENPQNESILTANQWTETNKAQKREIAQWNEMREILNEELPKDIRVQGIQRTSKGFDARYKATSRVYRYCCPSYIFDADIRAEDIPLLEHMFCRDIIQRALEREERQGTKLKGMDIVDLVGTAKSLLRKRSKIKVKRLQVTCLKYALAMKLTSISTCLHMYTTLGFQALSFASLMSACCPWHSA